MLLDEPNNSSPEFYNKSAAWILSIFGWSHHHPGSDPLIKSHWLWDYCRKDDLPSQLWCHHSRWPSTHSLFFFLCGWIWDTTFFFMVVGNGCSITFGRNYVCLFMHLNRIVFLDGPCQYCQVLLMHFIWLGTSSGCLTHKFDRTGSAKIYSCVCFL